MRHFASPRLHPEDGDDDDEDQTLAPANLPGAASANVPTPPPSPPQDSLDDIFGSAPPSPTAPRLHDDRTDRTDDGGGGGGGTGGTGAHHRLNHPSDIPRLRSIHFTNGYREGVAAGKEGRVQEGFDEGYGVGGEVALRTGWYIGALEGLAEAFPSPPSSEGTAAEGGAVREALGRARAELTVENLFGPAYFADGVWTYEVPVETGGDGEVRVSFGEVAECHPLVRKWRGEVRGLVETVGLALVVR